MLCYAMLYYTILYYAILYYNILDYILYNRRPRVRGPEAWSTSPWGSTGNLIIISTTIIVWGFDYNGYLSIFIFVWGFYYHFTNYNFRQTLGSRTNP